MKVFNKVVDLQNELFYARKEGKSIGLVPTMGALHEGHASLVKRSVKDNDVTIVSVFLNPTQFNDKGDLDRYPRTLDDDCKLIENCGADYVFAPSVEEMYPLGEKRHFEFPPVSTVMEGARRPGHFNGVCQVVSRLFYITRPNRAYFGEKDFQQLKIIEKLVDILNLGIKIHGVKIHRENNGLAMSSRNMRLSEAEKEASSVIYQTLKKVDDWFRVITIPEIKIRVEEIFDRDDMVLEYFLIANEDTLKEADFFSEDENYRAFIVVNVEQVRLIDNMHLK